MTARIATIVPLGLLLLFPTLSAASDGAIEINQVIALAGTADPNDTPGFPVTITRPGSYILTGNLNLVGENPNTDAIVIANVAVVIDLNGFTIIGTGPGGGAANGIYQALGRATVRNGSIERMAEDGLDLSQALVEGVHSASNGAMGILVTAESVVRNCSVKQNSLHGILATGGAVIQGNISTLNAGDGIAVWHNSKIEDNTVNGNLGRGIVSEVVDGGVIRGNTVRQNMDGIVVKSGYTIADNSVYLSFGTGARGIVAVDGNTIARNTVRSSSSHGIQAGDFNTIEDNTLTSNGLHGIVAGDGNRVADNTVAQNGFGIELGSGNQVRNNTSRENGGLGIRVFDDNTVSGNTSTANGTAGFGPGILLRSNNAVIGNTLSNNSDPGISVSASGFYDLVRDNVITKNGGRVDMGGGDVIISNLFAGNDPNNVDLACGGATGLWAHNFLQGTVVQGCSVEVDNNACNSVLCSVINP